MMGASGTHLLGPQYRILGQASIRPPTFAVLSARSTSDTIVWPLLPSSGFERTPVGLSVQLSGEVKGLWLPVSPTGFREGAKAHLRSGQKHTRRGGNHHARRSKGPRLRGAEAHAAPRPYPQGCALPGAGAQAGTGLIPGGRKHTGYPAPTPPRGQMHTGSRLRPVQRPGRGQKHTAQRAVLPAPGAHPCRGAKAHRLPSPTLASPPPFTRAATGFGESRMTCGGQSRYRPFQEEADGSG